MSDELNILRFLGLAAKAGKVTSGFDQVEAAIRKGNVKLLILSKDISRNTLSQLLDIGVNGGVDLVDAGQGVEDREIGLCGRELFGREDVAVF